MDSAHTGYEFITQTLHAMVLVEFITRVMFLPAQVVVVVDGYVRFQLEPTIFRSRAVHVNSNQPIVVAIPLTKTQKTFIFCRTQSPYFCFCYASYFTAVLERHRFVHVV